eukprot:TRINITY_DN113439_c0_g1_i1.p1 TRINITY_DN113439_c0_g1~~TRINITY_DN113439_c0_g1_i1.p1  ORF type:complete len:456 (+),score=69.81 TRINITY_DN113439_c0_g1_i1:78-1445(+)
MYLVVMIVLLFMLVWSAAATDVNGYQRLRLSSQCADEPPIGASGDTSIRNLISMSAQAYGGGPKLYDQPSDSNFTDFIYTGFKGYSLVPEAGTWTFERRFPERGGHLASGVHFLIYQNLVKRQIVVAIRGTDFKGTAYLSKKLRLPLNDTGVNQAAPLSDVCAGMLQSLGIKEAIGSVMKYPAWMADRGQIVVRPAGMDTFSEACGPVKDNQYFNTVVEETQKYLQHLRQSNHCSRKKGFHLIFTGHSLGGQTSTLAALAMASYQTTELQDEFCTEEISSYSFAAPRPDPLVRDMKLDCNAGKIDSVTFAAFDDPVMQDVSVDEKIPALQRHFQWVCLFHLNESDVMPSACSCSHKDASSDSGCFEETHVVRNFINNWRIIETAWQSYQQGRCVKPGGTSHKICIKHVPGPAKPELNPDEFVDLVVCIAALFLLSVLFVWHRWRRKALRDRFMQP